MNPGVPAAHQNAHKWDENWIAVSIGEGGGQGDVKFVVRKDGSEPDMRFLKILRHQNDASRRQRMYREVAAYQTLGHPGIPTLIETNADNFEDQAFKLYLVTEAVAGTTLGEYVTKRGPLPLQDAIKFTIALLDIVDHCHQSDIVHRDIKPDNIILRGDDPSDPVLVDFGLSFNRDDVAPNATEIAEEVGNRFLRLPELAPNSPTKRDPRSDLTFCAGVLLYAMTGDNPAVLMDSQDQLPHQVEKISGKLQALGDDWRVRQLRRFFDTAFQHAMNRRWQSANELKSELLRIESGAGEVSTTHEALLEEVRALQSSTSLKSRARLTSGLEAALREITAVMSKLEREEIDHVLRTTQTDQVINVEEGWAKTSLCFALKTPQTLDTYVQFRVDAVGTDLVVSALYAGKKIDLHRTSLEALVFDAPFVQAVEKAFFHQIRDELQRDLG